ncbi:MAG: A/G-specific adenine glycosylase [Elusimicrobia bacterium]|nr:A/G-specific adenine glycosylase [Elusimicrobiota bacterium]
MRPSARKRLLDWYRRSRRELPWRKSVSPYRTWVSEIMLQQTTVATVLPYYERFLERFPDIASLAQAPQEDVLRLWAGLGYYSRARNLQEAARRVLEEHGGKLPDDYEGLIALPGIGRYTAGAILSIAFGKPYPVLDGNVARVLSRFYGLRGNVKAEPLLGGLWDRARALLPESAPGDWNQALMELGATICAPESPRCAACPLESSCQARAQDAQDVIPETGSRRPFKDLKWTCLWIEKEDRVLLWRRCDSERFLKGHWGLPEKRHMRAQSLDKLKSVTHTITHHRISVDVFRARPPQSLPEQARWVRRGKLEDYLVSSLWLKCVS